MDGRSNALTETGLKIHEISDTSFVTTGTATTASNRVTVGSIWERYGYTGAGGCVFGGNLAIQSDPGSYSTSSGYRLSGTSIDEHCTAFASSIFTEDVVSVLQNGYYIFELVSRSGNFYSYIQMKITDGVLSYNGAAMYTSSKSGYTKYTLMSIFFLNQY